LDPLSAEQQSCKQRKRRVLLVEEDFLTRWAAAEYLRETGFDVIEAVSTGEALAAIRSVSAIDAVFCAMQFTLGTEGEELLNYLQNQRPPLPVLLASDGADCSGKVSEGATLEVVDKPYVMSDVEQRLSALIAARHLNESRS